MLLFRDDFLVGFPEICITVSRAISLRHLLPKLKASRCPTITDNKCDDLPCATAQCDPNPTLATLLENE